MSRNLAIDPAQKSILERWIELERTRLDCIADLKDLAKEAKSKGMEPAAIREAVKRHFEDSEKAQKRRSKEEAVEYLLAVLGDFAESPLGQAAINQAA